MTLPARNRRSMEIPASLDLTALPSLSSIGSESPMHSLSRVGWKLSRAVLREAVGGNAGYLLAPKKAGHRDSLTPSG